MSNKMSVAEFIERSNKIHQDKFDYTVFQYINAHTKGKIKCPIHGIFEQKPAKHLKGQGCKECGKQSSAISRTKTLEQFIKEANLMHKNKYIYTQSIYKDTTTYIKIICQEHGIFEQTPDAHLQGKGCKKCKSNKLSKIFSMTAEQFLIKAKQTHNNKYNYNFLSFINGSTVIDVTCPNHGLFSQLPYKHLQGQGCPKCGGKLKSTTPEFIKKAEKIHKNKYDYNEVIYINDITNIKINCPKHGIFSQKPTHHLQGQGCSVCNIRRNAQLVYDILTNYDIEFKSEKYVKQIIPNAIKKLRFDFYLPILNIVIEYNGHHHYQPVRYGGISLQKAQNNFQEQQKRDNYKRQICKENNIQLIEIDGRKYSNLKLERYMIDHIITIFEKPKELDANI